MAIYKILKRIGDQILAASNIWHISCTIGPICFLCLLQDLFLHRWPPLLQLGICEKTTRVQNCPAISVWEPLKESIVFCDISPVGILGVIRVLVVTLVMDIVLHINHGYGLQVAGIVGIIKIFSRITFGNVAEWLWKYFLLLAFGFGNTLCWVQNHLWKCL